MPGTLAAVLAAVNASAFAAFGIDKWKAGTDRRRIRESTLLRLALLGGTPGAYLGRRLFRHKTRKQPFVRHLHTIAFVQAMGMAGWSGWVLAGPWWP